MASAITTASVKVGLDASQFKSGVSNLKNSLGGIDNTFSKLGKDLFGFIKGNVASLAGLAGLGGLGVMLKKGFDAKQVFEKNSLAIKAFGDSAGDLDPLLNTLRQITFRNSEMGETAGEAARKLLSAGYSGKEAAALIKSFGAAAKASPEEAKMVFDKLTDTMLELKNSGVAQSADFKKLQELGLPVYDLLAKRLTDVNGRMINSAEAAEMLQRGMVSSKDAIIALGSASSDPRIIALQSSMKATLPGAIGNLKGEINTFFANLVSGFDQATGATSILANGINKIAEWIKALTPNVETTVAIIKENWEGLGTVFAETGSFIGQSFLEGLKQIKIFFNDFPNIASNLGQSFINGLSPITSWFSEFINLSSNLGQSFINGLSPITSWFSESFNKVNELANQSTSYLGNIHKTAKGFLDEFGSTSETVWNSAGELIKTYGLDLEGTTNIWEGLYELGYSFWDMLKVGWIGIKSLGIEVINSWLEISEKFTKSWDNATNSIASGLAWAGNKIGLISEDTLKTLEEDNKSREQNYKPDFGRVDQIDVANETANELERQRMAREERKRGYQERYQRQQDEIKNKPTDVGPNALENVQTGKAIAGELAKAMSPALITRGGAEEYKLMVERQQQGLTEDQLKEQQKTNGLLDDLNNKMDSLVSKTAIPANPIIGLIAQV